LYLLFSAASLLIVPSVQCCPLLPSTVLPSVSKYNAPFSLKYSAALYHKVQCCHLFLKYRAILSHQIQCWPLTPSTVQTSFLQCYPPFPKYGAAISFPSTSLPSISRVQCCPLFSKYSMRFHFCVQCCPLSVCTVLLSMYVESNYVDTWCYALCL